MLWCPYEEKDFTSFFSEVWIHCGCCADGNFSSNVSFQRNVFFLDFIERKRPSKIPLKKGLLISIFGGKVLLKERSFKVSFARVWIHLWSLQMGSLLSMFLSKEMRFSQILLRESILPRCFSLSYGKFFLVPVFDWKGSFKVLYWIGMQLLRFFPKRVSF